MMKKRTKTTIKSVPRTEKRDVFISYSLTDGKIARMLCEKLESAGISVWYSTRDVELGMEWRESVLNALQNCKVFILIVTNISIKSEGLLSEFDFAMKRKFRRREDISIIPVLVDMEEVSDEFQYYLTRMQYFDARNQSLEESMDKLVKRVQEIMEKPQESVS